MRRSIFHCDNATIFSQATVGTIRLNFLKLGATITVSVRRIVIAITSACPYQDISFVKEKIRNLANKRNNNLIPLRLIILYLRTLENFDSASKPLTEYLRFCYFFDKS